MKEGYRILHNEELHNLYSSPNKVSDQVYEDDMGRARSMHEVKKMHIGVWWKGKITKTTRKT
jgi:hypothetical protein